MDINGYLTLTLYWLLVASVLCVLPTVLIMSLLAFIVKRFHWVRSRDHIKRYILAFSVISAFFGNFLVQTRIYTAFDSGVYAFYASLETSEEEFDPSIYRLRGKLMWRLMIIPPPLTKLLCADEIDYNAFCINFGNEVVASLEHNIANYLYVFILSGVPAAVAVYYVLRRILGPWRKQKRKDDFQPTE